MKPSSWHKVRGVAMIASMKAVGVAIDADTFPLPGPLEYMGYILCPATCLFGPWICYKDYAALYRANRWVNAVLVSKGKIFQLDIIIILPICFRAYNESWFPLDICC